MEKITLRPQSECKYDEVSLGEVMLRFDPGEGRIKTSRQFTVWEGGGEYNVARGLKRCFGFNTAIVTGIPDNDLGYLLQDLLYQGSVDTKYVKWFPYDGIGKDVRLGLNFTERGFGMRGALGVSDRGYTAAAKLKKGDIDWAQIFKKDGARWFHTGGIFAALSDTTPEVVIEALKAAKANGVITSYDLNYRPSLWKANGGKENAVRINREIAKYVDVMIGNEEDFTAALGFAVEGVDENVKGVNVANFKKMIEKVIKEFPNFKAVATTLREVHTASDNDWGAVLCYEGKFYESVNREHLGIMDRVGGGDSFASGLIYGFLKGMDPQLCVEFGAAHGALAMTTPGDTSMASLKEVEKLVKGGGARVDR
ncbi:MAG: sugar kinase [Deferribacteraceae bacterium]|jgi:2-dehydro-3-deoxygluconokinase|nr:sugar kinase [Deferribacteraceae bacterium]